MIKEVKLIIAALGTVILISCDISQFITFEEEILTGFISGSVEDNWGDPMIGVEVTVSNNYQYRTFTDSLGNFYLEAPEGYQWIDFYKDGYSFNSVDLYIYNSFTEFINTVVPFSEPETTGDISGSIVDVTTGNGVGNVRVLLSGDSVYSTTSDSTGNFRIRIPQGANTLSFEKSDYYFENVDVEVTPWENTTLERNSVLGSRELDAGQVRFVLTWNDSINDLDAYLLTPNGESVYSLNDSGLGVTFHNDVRTGYGPETITIDTQYEGNYRYYIYNVSDTDYFYNSDAKVRVYDYTGLVYTFEAPSSGFGRYWDVVTLNGEYLTTHETIEDFAPVNLQ